MALVITTAGNGVEVNGILQGKGNWLIQPSSVGIDVSNKDAGVSYKSKVTEVEVDGASFTTYEDLVTALGSILFKSGGTGPGSGVQSVTGDGVGGTPDNPVLSYPTPEDIGAATAEQGLLADSALQSYTETDPTVPAHVKSIQTTDIATWNAKQNALSIPTQVEAEAGTATSARAWTAQRVRQGANAAIAASNKVGSAQESGVGGLVGNIIKVTQAEYDALAVKNPGTIYAIPVV